MLTTLSVVLGALILAIVTLDIATTVLHPGVESPFSNRLHRGFWRVLRLLARPRPDRSRLLTAGLPLMVAGQILTWLGLLLVGYTFLYRPWLGDPRAFALPTGERPTWLGALYFSGATLSTLGYGDIAPLAWPLRLLAVTEAASGVATITLSVAYLLNLYPALAGQRALAIALDAETIGEAGGLPLVRRYLRGDERWRDQLDARLRELSLGLLSLTANHETHPILYYAHPRRAEQSVLRVLVTAQGLVGLLRYGLSPDRHDDLVRNPQVVLLEQALGYSLRHLAASLHSPTATARDDGALRQQYEADYRQLCAELEALGLVSAQQAAARPVSVLSAATNDADSASVPAGPNGVCLAGVFDRPLDPALDTTSRTPLAAYRAFRQATDPLIAAYAATAGYSLAEASSDDDEYWEVRW